MIAEYEGADGHKPFCLYGLDGDHKHLPEMWKFSGCEKQPLFVPSVDHSFCGMVVSTPVPTELFARPRVNRQAVYEVWRAYYADCPFVKVVAPQDAVLRDDKFLDLTELSHTNFVELSVLGRPSAGIDFSRAARQSRQRSVGQCRAVPQLDARLRRDRRAGLDARR